MASPADLRDRVSRLSDMLSVVAAEAAWELILADVVRIGSPVNAHLGIYVVRPNHLDYRRLCFNSRFCLQRSHRVAAGKRSRAIEPAVCDGSIDGRFRR